MGYVCFISLQSVLRADHRRMDGWSMGLLGGLECDYLHNGNPAVQNMKQLTNFKSKTAAL